MISSFWGEEEPRREQESANALAFSANTADDDEVTGIKTGSPRGLPVFIRRKNGLDKKRGPRNDIIILGRGDAFYCVLKTFLIKYI